MIGIGIDAVEVERFRRVLSRRPRLAQRLFSGEEREYAARQRDPSERLAARFAAKEATMKAMGVGLGAFAFRDVEIVRSPSGAPELVVRGRAADLAGRRGISSWKVSLSHTASMAEAVVVALG